MNINAIRDADTDAGFYAAACASDPTATWRGAVLYVSSDEGANYTALATLTNESTMGYTTNVLGDFHGGNIPDELTSVNVLLSHGSLSSTDANGLLSGLFACVIGEEILFGRDATLETNGSYTLRGFLRGRRGTEYAMGTHVIGERFVLLDVATMVRVPQETADIGIAKLYKGVSAGSSLASTTAKMHHESEDLVLWDRLTARAPACALHVEQMRAQHAEVAAQLSVLEPLLPPWRESADAAQRDAFATGVERLRDTLFAHLGEEEEKIVPVAAEMLSQGEWDEMSEHALESLQAHRKEMPRDVMSLQLGLLLMTIPEEERAAWTRVNLPAPVRILYKLLLKRRFDREMAELYPGRPVPSVP